MDTRDIARDERARPGMTSFVTPSFVTEHVMVALKGRDIDIFLGRPDPARPVILLYGSDAGLVHERADALVASAIDDPTDPFAVVRLAGDDIASDPGKLADEAMAVPMFSGRRAIRIKTGTRSIADSVEALGGLNIRDCRIVIEAGDIKPDSPLRKVCEKASFAVAIGCYVDNEQALARVIDEELRTAGLRIAPDARAALTALLGGDRQTSRNEVRKLALYAQGQDEISLDDVAAVVADAADLKMDAIVDGAFAGQPAAVETAFTRAMQAGSYPGVVITAAQRHAAYLHRLSLAVAGGTSPGQAIDSTFPRLHFSRKGAAETALRQFSSHKLAGVIEQLGAAALETRRQTGLAAEIAQRALLAIAVNARRRN